MLNEYPVFAEYHYYTKKWLESIMKLKRLEKFNLTIPVVYSTPRRAFAIGSSSKEIGDKGGGIYYAPPNQGNNWLPILTFHMTNSSILMEKSIPFENVFKKKVQDNNNNVVGYRKTKPFLTYQLDYTATLYCGLMQDADILLYKLMTEFRPQSYLWIGPSDEMNNPKKGLWAQMLLDGIADATEYEPSDIGERVIRKDITWHITEAYVPTMGYELDQKITEEIYNEIFLEDEVILE